MRRAIVKFDGGSRGNPGPAAAAAVVAIEGGPVLRAAQAIGEATNNVAEYTGLIMGLTMAKDAGVQEVHIYGDSLLVISHLNDQWRCRSDSLWPYLTAARKTLREDFVSWEAEHIRRNKNTEADQLLNRELDRIAGG